MQLHYGAFDYGSPLKLLHALELMFSINRTAFSSILAKLGTIYIFSRIVLSSLEKDARFSHDSDTVPYTPIPPLK